MGNEGNETEKEAKGERSGGAPSYIKLQLYRIVVYNQKTEETGEGLVKAESQFQAEEKGKEWAKNWEPQGYNYYGTFWVDFTSLEKGQVVGL